MPRPDNRRGGRGGLTRPTPNVTPVFEEAAGMQAPDLAIPETIAISDVKVCPVVTKFDVNVEISESLLVI